jgi:hypothetical protein
MTITYQTNEQATGQQAWSITEISRSHYAQDLPQCTCKLERDCAYSANRGEMRRIRDEKLKTGSKFTPGELSTLSAWGLLPD